MSDGGTEQEQVAPFPLPTFGDTLRGIAIALVGLAVVGAVSVSLGLALHAERGDLAFALIFSISAVAFEAWLAISAVLGIRGYPLRRRLDRLGVRKPRRDDLWLGFAALSLAFVIFGVYSALVSAIGLDFLEPEGGAAEDVVEEPVAAVLLGIALVALAPLVEEIFYRGLLVGGFWSRWGKRTAIVAAGVLFCVSHRDLGAAVPLVLVGIMLGYVYARTGSIFVSLIPHFLFNALSFIVLLGRG
jgi:membrane protease YdiL (CAAX protease family)